MSENPLQNILTPSQFQQCVQFYEADQKLDHAEGCIGTQLQTREDEFGRVYYGYARVFAPTFYYRAVGRVPTRCFGAKTVLSLVLGFGTLLLGITLQQSICMRRTASKALLTKT